jgi:hypothetical protein
MALSALFFAFAVEQRTLSWVIAGTLVVSATFAYIIVHDVIVWRNKRKIKIVIDDLSKFYGDGCRIRDLEILNPMSLEEYNATVIPWKESVRQYLEQNCPDCGDMVKRFNTLPTASGEPIKFLDELKYELDSLSEVIRYYQNARH